jgi:acetyl esterase/lipase
MFDGPAGKPADVTHPHNLAYLWTSKLITTHKTFYDRGLKHPDLILVRGDFGFSLDASSNASAASTYEPIRHHPATLVLAPLTLARAQPQTSASAQAKLNVKRDIQYAEPADPRQKVDIYAPEGAKNLPVVFWIHGGGWQAGDRSSVQLKPQAFADRGFVFVSTGYRLLTNVDMVTIFRDIAKSVRWMHDHIAEYGADPNRILVMGHSAGAQLAALICIDDRYLKAEGLSLAIIKGCVPVDGDTYDVPAIIETVETRLRVHGQPMPKFGHRVKFGNDPKLHRDYSAVTHVARGKGIPPFLILHVADHPDTSAQAERLEAVLKDAGIPTKRLAAKETNHTKLNENLGQPDDPPTKALFEFVSDALKK